MNSETQQSRTEAATPQRRRKALEEGTVLSSPDLATGIVLLMAAILFRCLNRFGFATTYQLFSSTVSSLPIELDWPALASSGFLWLGSKLLSLTAAILVIGWSTSLLIRRTQSPIAVSWDLLVVKWDRIALTNGIARTVSLAGAFRGVLAFARVLAAVAILAIVTCLLTNHSHPSGSDLRFDFQQLNTHLTTLTTSLGLAAVFAGMLDYAFQWHQHEQRLRMSRQEIKDEQKEDQGDPQIRSQRKRAHRESLQRRTLHDVPSATVVLKNPTHFAVAIRYESRTMNAPVIVAKGSGVMAIRISRIAAEHGVPVLERKPLARALYAMSDIGDEIPSEFYRAIAEVLTHVYQIKSQVNY